MSEGNSAVNPQAFRGGMPYEPDVERLKEAYPIESLTESRIITHQELSDLLKYASGTQRYYGVINSWVSMVETKYDIVLEWQHGIGLKVLQPHERLQSSEGKIRRGIRATSRGVRSLSMVQRDRLDDGGKQRYDHVGRVSMVLKTALQQARKQLPIDIPATKSLPKKKK